MFGYVLASGLVLGSQIWLFRRGILIPNRSAEDVPENHRFWRQKMFAYAWPFMSWGIFSWMQQSSDRWALQIFSTTHEVGLYAVLNQLGYQPVFLLTGLIVQLVTPVFFQKAGDATDPNRVKRVYDLNFRLVIMTIGLTLCAVLAAWLLHDLIFILLAAPDYYESSWLLPGMVLSGGLFAAGQIASLSFMSSNQTHMLIAPKILTAMTGLLFNCIGAAWLGLPGVVAASIAFSLFYLLWLMKLLRPKSSNCNV
jgi:O-antigen/teichoic acid export membrane protein